MPITLLTVAAFFLPGQAKVLSAHRYPSLYLSSNNALQMVLPTPAVTNPVPILSTGCMQHIQVTND